MYYQPLATHSSPIEQPKSFRAYSLASFRPLAGAILCLCWLAVLCDLGWFKLVKSYRSSIGFDYRAFSSDFNLLYLSMHLGIYLFALVISAVACHTLHKQQRQDEVPAVMRSKLTSTCWKYGAAAAAVIGYDLIYTAIDLSASGKHSDYISPEHSQTYFYIVTTCYLISESVCWALSACLVPVALKHTQLSLVTGLDQLLEEIRTHSVAESKPKIRHMVQEVRDVSNRYSWYISASTAGWTSLILLKSASNVSDMMHSIQKPNMWSFWMNQGYFPAFLFFLLAPLHIAWGLNSKWKQFLEELSDLGATGVHCSMEWMELEHLYNYAARQEVGYRCFGIIVGSNWLQRTTLLNVFISAVGALSVRLANTPT